MKSRFVAMIQPMAWWILLALLIGAALRFSRLGDFANQYYTATVVSMLESPHNFLFGSFDPGGVVTVDKPPFSLWLQAVPVALFGPSKWAVALPQAVIGTFAIPLLYLVMRRGLGRVAALAAALVLAVMPASVIIDSGNEPDSLLSLTLLLAVASIIRAVETGRWRWLVAFAVLMGIGFNTKMLVAFVPLPAFLAYYVLASNRPPRQVLIRAAAAVALLLVLSFSWVTLVALTPAQNRPYIGSTRDNSVWTLVFKYNGLDRFTSFIGPRPKSPAPPTLQGGQPFGSQPQAPPSPTLTPDVVGILSLFTDRLAGQTGWLLPLALFMLLVTAVPLLQERVYARPATLLTLLRNTPAASQTLLWGGWFLTAVAVFGLANATITHPYYLVGLALPLAAVLGMGFVQLWQAFRSGNILSWLLPGTIIGAVAYQAVRAHRLVGDWAMAALLVVAPLAFLGMAVAIARKVTTTPLAIAFVAIGALTALLLPGAATLTAGGPMAGPSASLAGLLTPQRANPEQDMVSLVSSFIRSQGDAGSVFAVGAVNARQAAPFIIAGVPAVAIGGFSGGDPIFSLYSFRAMAERGELRYFLMPGQDGQGVMPGTPGRTPQEGILDYVRRHWEDVSRAAGLPQTTFYRYRASRGQP